LDFAGELFSRVKERRITEGHEKQGGLGLYIVQQSVDVAEYHYIANRNTY